MEKNPREHTSQEGLHTSNAIPQDVSLFPLRKYEASGTQTGLILSFHFRKNYPILLKGRKKNNPGKNSSTTLSYASQKACFQIFVMLRSVLKHSGPRGRRTRAAFIAMCDSSINHNAPDSQNGEEITP